jgi:pyridoxamine 5'-phosphate oxidase
MAGMRAAADPFALFRTWYREAAAAGTLLPEAMALATATGKGSPSVRMVLHRGFSRGGFEFFTNYTSRKSIELKANPRAAMVFHWPLVERQVRAAGRVEKLTRVESDRYFQSRPRESRIGAWISPQSAAIPGRSFLEVEFERARRSFIGKVIPRPPFWGGFRLVPDEMEFWLGQPHRLHDRLLYRRTGRRWVVTCLAP